MNNDSSLVDESRSGAPRTAILGDARSAAPSAAVAQAFRTQNDSDRLSSAPGIAPGLAELAQLDQWVVYLSKSDKAPRRLNEAGDKLIGANHSDPAHWTSYDQAIATAAAMQAAGVGFVFAECDPYSGIDLDGCRDKDTGALESWAQRIIDMCQSYTEISPSDTGVKIFVRGTLPEALIHSMGEHKGIEVYFKQRFFTITGNHLPGTPLEIRDAQYALDLLWGEYHKEPPAKVEKRVPIHQGERSTPGERAVARDVIDRLNRANDLGDYLESKGATRVREVGDARYYDGLAGDTHSHAVTYIVSAAKQGGHIGYSYSPNGKLNKTDFSRGFSWFDAVCALDHGGNVTAALKALNPIAPRRKTAKFADSAPLPEPTNYRTKAQDADAERKRAARRQAAAATLDSVRARAAQDAEMTAADRAVLDALLRVAGTRAWCRPSKDQLASISGYSIGSVKRSLMRLEARGYFVSEGKGHNHNTAVRTFLCGSSDDTRNNFVPKDDPQIDLESDLSSTLDLVSGAPASANVYASAPDEWQAADAEACDDSVLAWLYEQERAEQGGNISTLLEPQPPAIVSIGKPDARGMCLVRWSNGAATWQRQQAAEIPNRLEFAPSAAKQDLFQIIEKSPEPIHAAESEAEKPFQIIEKAIEPEAPGASYTPVELPDRPYTGQSKRHMDYAARMVFVRESMRPREQPAGTVNLLALGDPDADDPLVRCPPSEPKAAREYWTLKNKKAHSPKQAAWMRRRIAELEVLRPVSELAEMPVRGGQWVGRARSQAPARRAATVAQAVLL